MLLQSKSTIDARRVSDNKLVYLKRISRDSTEVQIAKFFSTEDRMRDPRNHCAPVLEYFEDEKLPEYGIIVTPLYRAFNKPDFRSIYEVLEFIRQTLEV